MGGGGRQELGGVGRGRGGGSLPPLYMHGSPSQLLTEELGFPPPTPHLPTPPPPNSSSPSPNSSSPSPNSPSPYSSLSQLLVSLPQLPISLGLRGGGREEEGRRKGGGREEDGRRGGFCESDTHRYRYSWAQARVYSNLRHEGL